MNTLYVPKKELLMNGNQKRPHFSLITIQHSLEMALWVYQEVRYVLNNLVFRRIYLRYVFGPFLWHVIENWYKGGKVLE